MLLNTQGTAVHDRISSTLYLLCSILLFLFISNHVVIAQHQVDLRLQLAEVGNEMLAVSLMMKSPDKDGFNLGNQNIRLFYNADHLQLQPGNLKSHLRSVSYGAPEVTGQELYELSIAAPDFQFENRVGFTSFNVALQDEERGGTRIDENWRHIYTVYFKFEKGYDPADIVIADPETTATLATAFTEISQWINSSTVEAMQVIINETIVSESSPSRINLTVGPNPTADYLYITAEEALHSATVFSMDGRTHIVKYFDSSGGIIDLTEVLPGAYFIWIEDHSGGVQRIEVIKSDIL